jgi:MFS family permease
MSQMPDHSNSIENLPDWLQEYMASSDKQKQLYKRTLTIVVISQIFGGAGLATGITVGALLAQDMLGTDRYAGIPMALFTLGSALAAFLVGRLSQRYGRRLGLATGFLAGGLGACGVVIAALTHNIFLLFPALFIYGSGMATNLQVRYAGTDLANAAQRGTAISIAMVSTSLGAVAGPNLVDVMGRLATSIGVPALAGPFILAALAYTLAGLVFFLFLRPDPLIVAKAIAHLKDAGAKKMTVDHAGQQMINRRGVMTGTIIMVLSHLIMAAIMTMTPVHMEHHGHGLSAIGLVIGIHIGAMYLPSLVTGVLVDKMGRIAMAIACGITLLAAGVLAAFSPGHSLMGLILALALLGLGWNLGLISGTALIVDATPLSIRAKTQGTVDVLVALAGSSGGVLSGVVAAQSSYATLSLAGGILSLLLIPVVFWSYSQGKNDAEASV